MAAKESSAALRLETSLDTDEPPTERADSAPLREQFLAVMSDPSLLLFHAMELGESEMMVKARLFRRIGNSPTMPYSHDV
jgi:hypothetical protein